MVRIHDRASPVAFFLLCFCYDVSKTLEFVDEELIVFIVFWHVLQNLSKSCKHPSIATSPEVLFAVHTLVLRINIASIAEIEACFFIKHNLVSIAEILVELVEILLIASKLIHLCHYRHHHI